MSKTIGMVFWIIVFIGAGLGILSKIADSNKSPIDICVDRKTDFFINLNREVTFDDIDRFTKICENGRKGF